MPIAECDREWQHDAHLVVEPSAGYSGELLANLLLLGEKAHIVIGIVKFHASTLHKHHTEHTVDPLAYDFAEINHGGKILCHRLFTYFVVPLACIYRG